MPYSQKYTPPHCFSEIFPAGSIYLFYMLSTIQILTMSSIRKPKRITIRGHDQIDYKYLVKGGEDLRQDQRIEQVSSIRNVYLERSLLLFLV